MSRPELCFVDATILSALITPGPASDQALRWLSAELGSWITSELSVALCLANLAGQGLSLSQQHVGMKRLLLVLRHGVGLRPLPVPLWQAPSGPGGGPLAPLQLLQLQAALHGRCGWLMSNDPAMVEAARLAGLPAFGLTIAAGPRA